MHQSVLDAVAKMGYTTPTPVQIQAIPALLQGRDILAAAQKGGLDVNGPLVLGGHMECFFIEDPDGFQVQVIKA